MIQRKKIRLLSRILVGTGPLFVCLFLMSLAQRKPPSVDVCKAIAKQSPPNDKYLIAEGERLVLMNCAHCHSDEDGRLAGHEISGVSPSLGRIVSANITRNAAQGIGGWTDAQLVTLLRTGVKPDGRKAHFIMPRYPLLAEADMRAIVAFLRSDQYAVKATTYDGPAHRPSLLSKLILNLFIRRLPVTEPVSLPDTNNLVAFGGYLVNQRYGCYACHSANVQKADALHPTQTKGYLAGGAKLLDEDNKPVYSANLTPDAESGFGRYTQTEFTDVMRLGRKRNGQPVRSPMLPYPGMTSREINAIYHYLQSIPPVHHVTPQTH